MIGDDRLAGVITELERVGIACLVMGGHAVRYFGLNRNTIDFDLHLNPDNWPDLTERLGRTGLFAGHAPIEGPSWRPQSLRRFQIGRLQDGREEWLEFWRQNHLLPPYSELAARREEGIYGGRVMPFLALSDLIRSKETERAIDWQDVSILEEFLDARLIVQVAERTRELTDVLSRVRSRRGFESHLLRGHLSQSAIVEGALMNTDLSITQAFLLPFAPVARLPLASIPIEPVILARLRTVTPASQLHMALVEAVGRQYKLACQAADKVDTQSQRPARTTER